MKRDNCKKMTGSLFLVFCILILIFSIFFFSMCCVIIDGDSMTPILKNGEVRVKNFASSSYMKGDIIVFRKNNIRYIKRIYATAGDKVEVHNRQLYINEKSICLIDEEITLTFILKINEYYVMGDNFGNSADSRAFGIVSYNDIEAKIYE